MNVLTQIRSRGYWHAEIRPAAEVQVVPVDELLGILEERQIRLRGWYLPHISHRTPIEEGPDWIRQESAWDYHIEHWRLDVNGRLILDRAMSEDWRGSSDLHPAPPGWEPGRVIQLWAVTNMTTEVLELAARLALSPIGADVMHINITMGGLEGRELVVGDPSRSEFDYPRVSNVDQATWETDIDRTDLAASAWEIALQAAQRLVRVFGYDAPIQGLRETQRSVFEKL